MVFRKLKRKTAIILFLVLLLILWKLYYYDQQPEGVICSRSASFHEKLHSLAYRVHTILEKNSLVHYLCYGALWGQIRAGRALPWQADVEMCLKNEQLIHDEALILKMFRRDNLNVFYDSADGLYVVTDPSSEGMKVELIVFEVDEMTDVSRRIGWKRRILPPDCTMNPSLHCFPPQLVRTPLPEKSFGGYSFPVPREEFEIQKYLYADDWWEEVVPKDCKDRREFRD